MGDARQASWGRAVDAAWLAFRQQLADHLAEFEDGAKLVIELEMGVDHDDLDGSLPYVQFVGWDDGRQVRAEVSSQHYLDPRYAVGPHGAQVLRSVGWEPPTHAPDEQPDDGSSNWWADHELREADLAACRATVALRDVFGAPHPSFLRTDARLQLTGAAGGGGAEATADERGAGEGDDEEPPVRFPHGVDELRGMVVEALGRVVDHPVQLDDDGDVPLVAGRSMLFVQALPDEPTLQLWSPLVSGVDDPDRAADEVALLNRDVLFGAFVLTDTGDVHFRHHLCAMPFAPLQLRLVVARVLSDLDRRAGDLVRRVGGTRFFDDLEPDEDDDVPVLEVSEGADPDEHHHSHDEADGRLRGELLVLRELIAAGAAAPATVAALFDGDLELMALVVDDLLTDPPATLDVADAVAALRGGLVFAAERTARLRWSRSARPPGRRPRSQQQELLTSDDLGEPVLDLGGDG
ncbi:T3SS (YopN, CesT) and YbjN peptide-binding chaperone 1 [Nocardioides perillae]|uniref:Uncharacterized protein n=1 Tax=Nocardioides perillae TaxID=1119534 RepID=A0A7Y9RR06_9ACTN|nr:hypothetical protein [Nocardioides perillae]NYG54966.1 hypothetical protein [Nocardioides perillae]